MYTHNKFDGIDTSIKRKNYNNSNNNRKQNKKAEEEQRIASKYGTLTVLQTEKCYNKNENPNRNTRK